MDYEIIARQNREDVVFYDQYGSYTGSFILVTEKDGVLRIYKDYFGSCSGCDNFCATFLYKDPILDDKKTIDFVNEYKPFLVRDIKDLTYRDIYDGVIMNNKDSRDLDEEEITNLINILCDKYKITVEQTSTVSE